MKLKYLIPVACALLAVSNTFAGVVTFEAAQTGIDLGIFYQGITFGANEQAILGTSSHPAKDGIKVMGGVNPGNDTLLWVFSTAETTVSFFYTAQNGFFGQAFDSSGHVVTTFSGVAGLDVDNSVSFTGTGITTVILTDSNKVGGDITIDNLTATGVNGTPRPLTVPDASSTFALLGLGTAALLTLRRKFAVQQ